jgi:hypothetical protein
MPYIYIDKVLNELRTQLLAAMHNAVERELHNTKVDVKRLYRAFNRAAAGQCSNPVHISDKCVENFAGKVKKNRAAISEAPED